MELDDRKTIGAMNQIMQQLKLPTGHRIEAFDHSHLQGTDLVSAMVCFVDGRPEKSQYRKYRLRTVDHADETASTREVIRRRYIRLLKEKAQLPDLILMDGAEIQIEAAQDVLQNELNLNIPVAGMVKNEHHKTADLMNNHFEKLALDPKSEGFYLLQRIQDEVHRFAITFHRQTHSKHSLASRLDLIPGVGPRTRVKLLKKVWIIKKKLLQLQFRNCNRWGFHIRLHRQSRLVCNHRNLLSDYLIHLGAVVRNQHPKVQHEHQYQEH